MKNLLWLDDVRDPFEDDWLNFSPIGKMNIEVHWVKSYDEFAEWINDYGIPDGICFDHDLGYIIDPNIDKIEYINGEISVFSLLPYNDDERTGYDCAKFLCEYCQNNNLQIPPYAIQSANPVGKENIKCYLENFKKHNC